MIIPTKYIKENDSLIGVSAILLQSLPKEKSISALWEEVKSRQEVSTFERFVLAIDLLFLLGVVELKNNCVVRVSYDS